MWNDLVCPADRAVLGTREGWLSCPSCGRGFPILDSIPTVLPADDDPRWRRAQRHSLRQLPSPRPAAMESRSLVMAERAAALEQSLTPWLGGKQPERALQLGAEGEGEIHHLAANVRYAVEPLAGYYADRGLLRWGQVRWVAACAEWLPFPDRHFDLVVLSDVLSSVESPSKALAEAARCLTKDGVIWLSLPLRRATLGERFSQLVGRQAGPGSGPPWRFSERHLRSLAAEAGLAIVWQGEEHQPALTPLSNEKRRRLRLRSDAPRQAFVMRPLVEPARVIEAVPSEESSRIIPFPAPHLRLMTFDAPEQTRRDRKAAA